MRAAQDQPFDDFPQMQLCRNAPHLLQPMAEMSCPQTQLWMRAAHRVQPFGGFPQKQLCRVAMQPFQSVPEMSCPQMQCRG